MTAGSAGSSLREAGTAERKLLTLLFADLSGYTRLTATHDPEDVLLAVGPLLADLRRIAVEHGGYVPSVQGDGFMAVFGAPTAHSDDPRRAVEAAIAMRTEVRIHRKRNLEVPDVHIGIASGEVLVTPHADGPSVIGPAVNLAARLSDAAVPGEVLVDESSAALTAEHACYAAARVLTLNGFTGGTRALPLEGLAAEPRTSTTPLAGRDKQLASLDEAMNEVRQAGSSAVLVLIGEPGVGKSQLVSTWAKRQRQLFVARGSARPYGSALPLSALSEAIVGADPPRPGGATEFVQLLPRQRTGLTIAREPDEALLVAARRWLTEVANPGPAVLILEDLHWADDSLLEAVLALHEVPIQGQLLVVGTSREPVAGLRQLPVPLLTADEIRHVAEHQLGARPDAALLQLLLDRSAGNALWLVECLSLLRDRGQLTISGEAASLRDQEVEFEVPASIRMLISARVDSLSDAQKLTLQRASVHPGDIALREWPGAQEDIDELVALRLLERLPSEALRFAHGLIREAIYRSIPRSTRVQEHERLLAVSTDPATCAYAALEVQRLDVAPNEERRTQLAEQALRNVTAHARHLRTSHTRAARDVLLRAEDLCTELDLVAPGAAAQLLTELAEVFRDLEERERSRRTAERALALAELADDDDARIRAELALGEACTGSDNATARHVAEQVLARAAVSTSLRGRAWQLLANSRAYDDMAELHACLEAAFDSYSAAQDTAAAAEVARLLAYNHSLTADATFDRWLDVAAAGTDATHLRGQGELALVRALVAQARGDWEQSWLAAESAMELLERAGLHLWLVDATAVALEAATATARRAVLPGLVTRLATLIEGHRARLQVTGMCATAPALMLLEREEEAQRALRTARDLLSSVGRNEESMVLVAEGTTAALAGRHADAETAYAEAEALAAELGYTLARLGCRLRRLQAQVAQGGRPGLRSDLLALAADLAAAGAAPHAENARMLAATLTQ